MHTLSAIFARSRRLTLPVAVLLATGAANGSAQTFTDGDFGFPGPSTWTSSTLTTSGFGSISTLVAAGGDPDAFLQISEGVYYGWVVGAHMSPFSWNPSTQGAITGLSVSHSEVALFNGMGFGTLLSQGGLYFRSLAVGDYNIANPGGGWNTVNSSNQPLTPDSWCRVDVFFTCGSETLDFSASGGEIGFGLYTANSGPQSIYGAEGGFDNFHVELTLANTSTTPEPSALLLLGTGLVAVQLGRRRRSAK